MAASSQTSLQFQALPKFRWLSRREILRIMVAFIATRAALVVIGMLANRFVPGLYGPEWQRLEDKPFLDMWFRWDAGFYTAIGTYGFNYIVNHKAASDIAFMPLFPLMIQLLDTIFGCVGQLCAQNRYAWCTGRECAVVFGVMISNVALFSSAFLLYDLIRRQMGPAVAMRSVWLLLVAPNNIFFSGVYTESLFIFLALVTFQALVRRYFAVAVVAAGLASVTREVGLALYPALIVYAWNQAGRARLLHLIAAQAAPLVFFGYVIGAGVYVGDWLAYFKVNAEVWGVSVGSHVLGSFGPYFPPYAAKEFISLWGAGPTWFNLAVTLGYLLLAIPSFKQNPSFGLFALVAILIPVAGGTLISMPRFGGVIFPHYSVGAEWADRRWRQVALYAACSLAAAFFVVRFVTWRWIS